MAGENTSVSGLGKIVKEDRPVVRLQGEIMTNSQGINKIMQYYHDARQFRDTDVFVDCYQMKWIDANLAAFLSALEHRLTVENNIRLKADFKFLKEKFGVLFRNGWLQEKNILVEDVQQTTIPCTSFRPEEEGAFFDYIKGKLLCHRGMPAVSEELRLRVQNDLLEIYTNIFRHSKTKDPFFICGQYYPRFGYFVLTMVDLGVGFLSPIQAYTNGAVTTDSEAIRWALQGNSTTGEQLAGMGLQGILGYCNDHKGIFQIYTGSSFWGTDLEKTIWKGFRPLDHAFQGSLLNLFFPYSA